MIDGAHVLEVGAGMLELSGLLLLMQRKRSLTAVKTANKTELIVYNECIFIHFNTICIT